MITAFGHAAARAVREDPIASISILDQFQEKAETDGGFVVPGLLYEAAALAPDEVLVLAWQKLTHAQNHFFYSLSRYVPQAAAEFLGTVPDRYPAQVDEAGKEVWYLTSNSPTDLLADPAFRQAMAGCAARVLPFIRDREMKARLLVTRALGSPLKESREELVSSWCDVPDDAFWLAVEALPDVRLALIRDMLSGHDVNRDRKHLLREIRVLAIPPNEWMEFETILSTAAGDPDLQVACSYAVKSFLYAAEGYSDIGVFREVALRLARSPSDDVRLSLIYCTGSPTRHPTPDNIAIRDKSLRRFWMQKPVGPSR